MFSTAFMKKSDAVVFKYVLFYLFVTIKRQWSRGLENYFLRRVKSNGVCKICTLWDGNVQSYVSVNFTCLVKFYFWV